MVKRLYTENPAGCKDGVGLDGPTLRNEVEKSSSATYCRNRCHTSW